MRLAPPLLALATLLPVAAAAAPPPPPVPTRLERLARLLLLEDWRSSGAGELERLLRDPDPTVRRRAALAAGRVGDAALVPALVELMNDPEAEIRQMAAFALGLVGEKGVALERLLAALGDNEAVVRARAAEALGRLGDASAARPIAELVMSSIPRGAPLLTVRGDDPGSASDPWIELRLALLALARLKDPAAAQAALLRDGQPRFDWWAATYCAMRVEHPALRPVLEAAASSSDPLSRALAARGLGALAGPAALERLGRLSRDADEGVAVAALRALGATGEAGATRTVAAALSGRRELVTWEALTALAALPGEPALRDRVVDLLSRREPWLRGAAYQAVARTAPEALPLLLSGLDPERDLVAQRGLAAALARAGDEVSVSVLHAMLGDGDARLLPDVLQALATARGADAVPTLVQHLEHPDFAVRAAAAEGLATLGARGHSALAAAYERARGDAEPEARLAALATLEKEGDGVARELLERAAREDASRVVRRRAGRALVALGLPAPAPGPVAIERPQLDALVAMLPYDPQGQAVFTPRAFLHTARGTIEIRLNVVEAPLTVASFVALARRGFYDGLSFHRVVPGFVVQGGCPRGDGNGGPGYTLRDELGEQPFGRGTVGMALSGADTAGSQFFITLAPQPHLDGGYTAFGWVAQGLELVDQIRPGDVIERVEVWDGR
jgi:cyclophilin family peptidyl-prolyl cis-trans isomerase/HEAT repeat protein